MDQPTTRIYATPGGQDGVNEDGIERQRIISTIAPGLRLELQRETDSSGRVGIYFGGLTRIGFLSEQCSREVCASGKISEMKTWVDSVRRDATTGTYHFTIVIEPKQDEKPPSGDYTLYGVLVRTTTRYLIVIAVLVLLIRLRLVPLIFYVTVSIFSAIKHIVTGF